MLGIISSQVFDHLRSVKGWIQTEACVIPSYHGMLMAETVVPSRQKLSIQPKLKHNKVHLI